MTNIGNIPKKITHLTIKNEEGSILGVVPIMIDFSNNKDAVNDVNSIIDFTTENAVNGVNSAINTISETKIRSLFAE